MLRAQAATWFEILVARGWLGQVMQELAGTRVVEFDTCEREGVPLDVSGLKERLAAHREVIGRHAEHHPPVRFRELDPDSDLEQVLMEALQRVESWADAIGPHVRRLEALRHEAEEARLLREFLLALEQDTALDFDQIREPGASTRSRLFVLDAGTQLPPLDHAVKLRVDTADHSFLLVVTAAENQALDQAMAAAKARSLRWPSWMTGTPQDGLAACDVWLAELEQTVSAERAEIHRIAKEYRVAEALGDIKRLQWLFDHLGGVPVSDHLAWITGWTSDPEGAALRDVVERLGIPTVVHFPAPPPGKVPPTVILNPRWVRPFELFGRLVGTPSLSDPEPSRILAIVAPLLFGYMFADVGQGFVLIIGGLLLRRRWPDLAILIPGGLMAMVFGVLFGSVFGSEELIPPVWLHPLEAPLIVLAAPLIFGAGLILFGMLLGALTALWSRHAAEWFLRDLGLVVSFIGACALFGTPYGALALVGGVFWYMAGSAWLKRTASPVVLGGALGEFAERAMQLAVNTISFVRVGAFALAHAGLGLAVYSLATAADNILITGSVLVIGNAGIIVLEGLVVSIQTTRLILFEFFIRFYTAEGRPFRPTLLPPVQ